MPGTLQELSGSLGHALAMLGSWQLSLIKV